MRRKRHFEWDCTDVFHPYLKFLVIANCILVAIQPNQRSAQRAGAFGALRTS